MAMKEKARRAWQARMKYIAKEYPFGPITMAYNEENRLHKADGFAYITPTRCIQYSNGRKHGLDVDVWGSMNYFYENINVPSKYVLAPDTVTVDEVMNNPNAEIKYAGIKIIGYEKMIDKFDIIEDDTENSRQLVKLKGVFADPVAFVKVINSTAEADGSYKPYFLCVPPTMKTCQEAVAWTFSMEAQDYAPKVET